MPDNQTRGILEDFLRFLVPPGSALFTHVQSSVAGIPAAEKRFTELAEPKAIIHTWLAWQEEIRTPLGLALAKSYLKASSSKAQQFMSWIAQLFELP